MLRKNFGLIELFVGLAIIIIALIPLSLSFHKEAKCMRGLYYHAVAEQVLDGYREILMAGEWKNHPMGTSILAINNKAFNSLPKGKVALDISRHENNKIKLVLSWKADNFKGAGQITKEALFDENN